MPRGAEPTALTALGLSEALQIKVNAWCSKGRERGFALRESPVTEELKKTEDPRCHTEQGRPAVHVKSSVLIKQRGANPTKGRVYSVRIPSLRFL